MIAIILESLDERTDLQSVVSAFRSKFGGAPDIIATTHAGFNFKILKAPSDCSINFDRATSDEFVAQTLTTWYVDMELGLRAEGLDKVCGLSLWELIKDSLFADMVNRVFPLWVVNKFLDSYPIGNVCVVHHEGKSSSILNSLSQVLSK